MIISHGCKEQPSALLEFKDDEDESSEDENSSKEDLTVNNNETNSGSSAFKSVKHYCRVFDFKSGDIMEWEKEVDGMMESVRKIHLALSEGSKIDNVFKFHAEEVADWKQTNNDCDLKVSFEEIEKMEAILRMKATEEKKAKLSRIQAEEESRDILSKLPRDEMTNGMKLNLEEFMRLLNDADKSDEGFSSNQIGIETDERNEDKTKDKEKNDKMSDQQKTSNLKFVERNIQLAKCGRGTLSLTDEEKSRIESLLMDVEAAKEKRAEDDFERKKEFYAIDDDTKSVLSQIDERLEGFAKSKTLKGIESKLSLLEKKVSENSLLDEEEKENGIDGRKKENKKPFRLKEIDKLLNSINSVSSEEISPLTEEQIVSLIEESKQSLEQQSAATAEEKEDWTSCRPSQEVIAELVTKAKSLMPKFKYRFDDS